jgi:glycyl-tRNA synthetase beta chain
VRVLLDFWPAAVGRPQPSLAALADRAVEAYGGTIADPGAARTALRAFLLERLRYVLTARGFAADEVEAVLGAREPDALDDLKETRARLEALRKVRSEAREAFEHLATAFKRAANILEQAKDPSSSEVQPQLFEGDAERALFDAVKALSGQDGGYEARLRALATLRDPVDRFFDPQRGVFVMTDKAELRRNRLALLDRMRKLFYRIADISKLGG